MENIDYKTAIQAELQYLPEQYLAHLYQIIQLMASPFKETKTVDKETLQAYADTFKESYSLFTKNDIGINFSYQIQEKFTILKISFPVLEEEQKELIEEQIDLEKLCAEKKVKIVFDDITQEYTLQNLVEINNGIEDKYTEKMLIFDFKTGIYLIETILIEKWQVENAQTDARNLASLMLRAGEMYHKTQTA